MDRTTFHYLRPALQDAARRRAAELRAQAFDTAFDAGALALRRALRAAARFASALARHRRLRAGI